MRSFFSSSAVMRKSVPEMASIDFETFEIKFAQVSRIVRVNNYYILLTICLALVLTHHGKRTVLVRLSDWSHVWNGHRQDHCHAAVGH